MAPDQGAAAQDSNWDLGPEIFHTECRKGSCRSFFASSNGQQSIVCYAKDAEVRRDRPIHTFGGKHGVWPHTPIINVNVSEDSRTLPRYWSILDAEGNAAHGVLVGNTLARPLIPSPLFEAVPIEQALNREDFFGTAELTLNALSWLRDFKQSNEVLCSKFVSARRSLADNEFVLFPFLPKDLRVMIFDLASHHERIIEIRHQPAPGVPESERLHCFYTVDPRSYQRPPIFHVSHESHDIASRHYKPINLEFRHLGSEEKTIMFNPIVDIVLFRNSCCIKTIEQFCRITHHRGQEITRVAVPCSYVFHDHCEVHVQIPEHGGIFDSEADIDARPIDIIRGFNTTGNENMAWSLHQPNDQNNPSSMEFYPGLPGLKELLFVVGTHLDGVESKHVDYTTTFRRVDSSAEKDRVERQGKDVVDFWIGEYSKAQAFWEVPAANPWVGPSLPKFSFISLTHIKPSENGNTVRTYVLMSRKQLKESGILYQEVKNTIEAITGCFLSFPLRFILKGPTSRNVEAIKEDVAEIGLSAPNDASIRQAKSVLRCLLAQKGSWFPYYQKYLWCPSNDPDRYPFVDAYRSLFGDNENTSNNQMARYLASFTSHPTFELPNTSDPEQPEYHVAGHRRSNNGVGEPNPIYKMMDMLNMIDASTTPSRPVPGGSLVFPAVYDPIEKHRWWLSDRFYRSL